MGGIHLICIYTIETDYYNIIISLSCGDKEFAKV